MSEKTIKEIHNESWNECSENPERAVIIEKNSEALLQRVRLIKNAKEEIILSTFAFKSDESGKLILGALRDAADRGVHVRLLVDGMERSSIIQAEAQGNWLQRSWRPIIMLVFATIVLIGTFFDLPILSDTSRFWDLLEIGIGGYVIGRSAEKITGRLKGGKS